MNKLISYLFFLSILCTTNTNAYEYKIGVIEYPPHIVMEDSKPSGKAIDYIKFMIEKNGDQVKFSAMPVKRALKRLNDGDLDMLFPLENSVEKVTTLTKPLFNLVPGLCFRKSNFIPILSATHRFSSMKIGYADGIEVSSPVIKSGANLYPIRGKSVLGRGLKMLKANRLDAIYHPNPIFLYHKNNPHSKDIACSYFHGLSTNTYLGISDSLSSKKRERIEKQYSLTMKNKSYIEFFNTL